MLRVFEDGEGAVTVGWVGPSVLYARYRGSLSAEVGNALANTLRSLVAQQPSVQYFADASKLESYDLVARSAFVRVVLAERRRFKQITMLTWQAGITSSATAFVEAIGEPIELLTDAELFEARLCRAAPNARGELSRPGTRPAARPSR